MSAAKQFTKEIKDETTFSASWLPNSKISLGDIGRLDNYEYRHKGDLLSNYNISFETVGGTFPLQWQHMSKDGVSYQIKPKGRVPLDGSNLVQASAGVSIKFSKENTLLFSVADCQTTRIKNVIQIEDELKKLAKEGKWDKKNIVVTELVTVSKIAIFVAGQKGLEVEFNVGAELGAGQINFARVLADGQIVKDSSFEAKLWGTGNYTPLFKGIGIKKRFLVGPWTIYYVKDTPQVVLDLTKTDDSTVGPKGSHILDLTKTDDSNVKPESLALNVSEIDVEDFGEVDYGDFEE